MSEVDLDPESESDAAVSSMIFGMYEDRSNLQNNAIDCMIRTSCGAASKSVGKALPLTHGKSLDMTPGASRTSEAWRAAASNTHLLHHTGNTIATGENEPIGHIWGRQASPPVPNTFGGV